VLLKRRPELTALEAVEYMKEHFHLQVCGDDVRIFALTRDAAECIDLDNAGAAYLKIWEEDLPWTVKPEGHVSWAPDTTFEERVLTCPHMVSRGFVYIDGALWEPLINISRVLKRLYCCQQRDQEEEAHLVVSAFATLAMQVTWQLRPSKAFYSTALENLITNFANYELLDMVYRRAAFLNKQIKARQENAETPISRAVRLW
jgi:hypothetical protein